MSTHYLIDTFTPAAHLSEPIVDVVSPVAGLSDATGSLVVRVPDGVAIHGNPSTLGALLTAKYNGMLAYYSGFANILSDPCIDPTNVDLTTLSGAAASVTASAIGSITVSGLAGIPVDAAGGFIALTGCATPGNNGNFRVLLRISATSCILEDPGGSSPDANNGAISWIFSGSHGLLSGNNQVNHCLLPGGTMRTLDIPLATTPEQCIVVWETFAFTDVDPKSGLMQRGYQETTLDPFADIECDLSFNSGTTFLFTVDNGNPTNIPVPDQGSTIRLTFTNLTTDRIYLGSWAVIY